MDIDTAKTAAYYQSLTPEDLCSCNDCLHYRKHICRVYPQISSWLHSFGIDIEKPLETSPLGQNKQGYMEYCGCQYVAFGECEPDFCIHIGPVTLRKSASFPPTGISEPHFVLEFFPILLPADNDLL